MQNKAKFTKARYGDLLAIPLNLNLGTGSQNDEI